MLKMQWKLVLLKEGITAQITYSQISHINDGKDTIFETYQVPKSLIFLNIYASFLSDFQTPWKRKKQGSKSWFSVKVIKIDVGNSLTDGMSKKYVQASP